MSAEPGSRKSAYSADVRLRVVYQRIGMELTFQTVAQNLNIAPYSLDLNPIEEAFNYVKSYLRKHDVVLQSGAPLTTIVEAAFQSITTEQCKAWITDSGYPQYYYYYYYYYYYIIFNNHSIINNL